MTSQKNNPNSVHQAAPGPLTTQRQPRGVFPRRCASLACLFGAIACAVFLNISAMAQPSTAANTPTDQQGTDVAKHLETLLSFAKDDGFVYKRKGRPDPFKPFISAEKIKAELSKSKEALTGLQRFEPGQLKLVAIVFAGDTGVAMVQDSSGMGYVVRKGMKIGLRNVVSDIVPNTVIIKQRYQTISGESRFRTVEMVLKKEGEKSQ